MKLRDIREYCQITKSTQRLIDELKQMVKGIGQALFFQKVRCYVELMEFREAAEILLLIRSKCKLGGTGFDFQQIYSDKVSSVTIMITLHFTHMVMKLNGHKLTD